MRYAEVNFLRACGILIHTVNDDVYGVISQFGVMDDYGNWVRINPAQTGLYRSTYLHH